MILLDTHVAIWWFAGDTKLGRKSRKILGSNDCVFSAAGLWEAEIKHGLGKLPCDAKELERELERAGAAILPVHARHVAKLNEVRVDRGDPFDRILLATSLSEGYRFMSADRAILSNETVPVLNARH